MFLCIRMERAAKHLEQFLQSPHQQQAVTHVIHQIIPAEKICHSGAVPERAHIVDPVSGTSEINGQWESKLGKTHIDVLLGGRIFFYLFY